MPETDYLHRCFWLLGLFKLSRSCSLCEVLFCYAVVSERFPMCACLLITWTVNLFMMICCLLILTLPASPSYSIVCLPPVSTLSTNSVYEYALPSLYLMPVTDLCLSDLSCDLIKLHIDPDATGSLHVFKKRSKVTLIQKGHINLIKSNSQEICNV